MNSTQAESFKQLGNTEFQAGQYDDAIRYYSLAIQHHSTNPLYYTNRANARLKIQLWQDVIDDCLKSIEYLTRNTKAYYFLGQAQLELNHPNEALISARKAYDLCTTSSEMTTSAYHIAAFVRRCKRAKWDLRERARIRERSALLADLVQALERDRNREMQTLMDEVKEPIALREDLARVQSGCDQKINELKSVFAIADPEHLEKREVPDYLIDNISFEIMHDPVMTIHGDSYDRTSIMEAIKSNPCDPIWRDKLTAADLRSNRALKNACDEFWENSKAWAYDF